MRAREVNRRIEALGGVEVSQKGSHRKYRASANGVSATAIVPQHGGKEIPVGTLRSIEKSLEAVFGKGWLR